MSTLKTFQSVFQPQEECHQKTRTQTNKMQNMYILKSKYTLQTLQWPKPVATEILSRNQQKIRLLHHREAWGFQGVRSLWSHSLEPTSLSSQSPQTHTNQMIRFPWHHCSIWQDKRQEYNTLTSPSHCFKNPYKELQPSLLWSTL